MAVTAAATREATGAGALDRLLAATHDEMLKVNTLILERAQSHVDMVPELARYLIDAGGKRLRPMLTVAAAQLYGRSIGEHVNFAAAVEFLHNATLLHDDVVDESDMRRGRPAARMIWGNQASVLVGDFLLGQAFMMMVETANVPALEVIARAATIIAEGEVFQLSKAKDLATSAADYDEIIGAKTAMLFQAATEVGAMAGGADEAGRQALRDYGRELGMAFQLVDDVLDYRGESGTMGKNAGDDLREGKMTLPVILALAEANPAEREIVASSLGRADANETTLSQVVAIMNRHRTLARTLEKAETHVQNARAALASVPDGELNRLLSDMADFYVTRAYGADAGGYAGGPASSQTPHCAGLPTASGVEHRGSRNPVAGEGFAQVVRRLVGSRRRAEQPEHRSARSRHAREDAAFDRRHARDQRRDRRHQSYRGRLEVVARLMQPDAQLGRSRQRLRQLRQRVVGPLFQPPEHVGRHHGHQRIDEHDMAGGKPFQPMDDLAHPAHFAGAGAEAGRHIGAQRQGELRQFGRRHLVCTHLHHHPQRRRRIGRTATQAGGHRQVLVQGDIEPERHVLWPAGAKRRDCARNEVGVARSGSRRKRTRHLQPVDIGASRYDLVGDAPRSVFPTSP